MLGNKHFAKAFAHFIVRHLPYNIQDFSDFTVKFLVSWIAATRSVEIGRPLAIVS
jgi:hypothetical protein